MLVTAMLFLYSMSYGPSSHIHCSLSYLHRIVCTIIAPTPLLAANFVILARIIGKLGDSYSRLGPRLCRSFFLYIPDGGITDSSSDSRIFLSCVSIWSVLLSPLMHTAFSQQDVIALVVQGGGGGIASGNNLPQSQINLVSRRIWVANQLGD